MEIDRRNEGAIIEVEQRKRGLEAGVVQFAEQLTERFSHGAAGAIGLFHQVGHLFPERQAVQGCAEFAHGWIRQGAPADRLGAGGAAHFEFDGPMLRIEDPYMIDFREIVILGGLPEDGNRGDAVAGQPLRELDGMQQFVNCVGWA